MDEKQTDAQVCRLLEVNARLRQKLKAVQKSAKEYKRTRAFEEFSDLHAQVCDLENVVLGLEMSLRQAQKEAMLQRAINKELTSKVRGINARYMDFETRAAKLVAPQSEASEPPSESCPPLPPQNGAVLHRAGQTLHHG
jgi:chromosome segregation ATPase